MFMNVNIKQMAEVWEASEEARKKGLAEGHAEGLAEGRAEEQANSLRMLCSLVANGDLSIDAAIKGAATYGITSESDLRTTAEQLGIHL